MGARPERAVTGASVTRVRASLLLKLRSTNALRGSYLRAALSGRAALSARDAASCAGALASNAVTAASRAAGSGARSIDRGCGCLRHPATSDASARTDASERACAFTTASMIAVIVSAAQRGFVHNAPQRESLMKQAPYPARGTYDEGFARVARTFAAQLTTDEIGAGLCVYHRGRCVVDVWGGVADMASGRAWEADTRCVVFSITKGLAAMAMLLLVDRGRIELDAPVSEYWPGFDRASKGAITVRALLNHRAGLCALDRSLDLVDCVRDDRRAFVLDALEENTPKWEPGTNQGYHAITYGMYVRELFERVTGERLGSFLRREVFDPLGSDARLGTGADEDARTATLIAPAATERFKGMARMIVSQPDSPEAHIAKDILSRDSLVRRTFGNPKTGLRTVLAYGDVSVRRAELAWASATASARGVARAYLPFAQGGTFDGREYVKRATLAPVYERQSFADRDRVLGKSLGWSQGFLKEEQGVFGPTREAFGHAGLGGALGWCDPVHELTFGYVMNKLDWRVRSPRALALCESLYASDALKG